MVVMCISEGVRLENGDVPEQSGYLTARLPALFQPHQPNKDLRTRSPGGEATRMYI
jgi:hypothetical protein